MFATVWPMSPQACWTTPRVTCGCSSYRSFGHRVFSTLMPARRGICTLWFSVKIELFWNIRKNYRKIVDASMISKVFDIFLRCSERKILYHVILKNNLVSQRYDSEEIFTRSNESKYFSKRSQKRSLAKWLKCKNKRSRSSFSWNVSKDESRRGNRSGTQLFSTRKSSCHCTRE